MRLKVYIKTFARRALSSPGSIRWKYDYNEKHTENNVAIWSTVGCQCDTFCERGAFLEILCKSFCNNDALQAHQQYAFFKVSRLRLQAFLKKSRMACAKDVIVEYKLCEKKNNSLITFARFNILMEVGIFWRVKT